jgi:hypothetical protein
MQFFTRSLRLLRQRFLAKQKRRKLTAAGVTGLWVTIPVSSHLCHGLYMAPLPEPSEPRCLMLSCDLHLCFFIRFRSLNSNTLNSSAIDPERISCYRI